MKYETYPGPNDVLRTVRISEDEDQALRDIARKEGTSVPRLTRRFVEEGAAARRALEPRT